MGVGGLQVERDRVVDGGGYAGGMEPGLQGVAAVDLDSVLGEDAGAVRPLLDTRNAGLVDEGVVALPQCDALRDLMVEARELGEEHGALQGVHAAADSDAGVDVALALAVDADFAAGLGELVVAGENGTAVAVAAERFAGEEAGAAEGAEVAASVALVGGAEALGGIFDDGDVAMAGGDGVDGVHVGGLAVEADRQDGLGAVGDPGFDQGGVDVAGVGFDIDEDRFGAEQDDDFGGGDKGEGSGDDFIAGADAEGHEADEQGFGAAGDGDAVFGAGVGGEVLFEFADFGAEDVLAVVQYAMQVAFKLRPDGVLLGLEVDEVDRFVRLRWGLQVLFWSNGQFWIAFAEQLITGE